VIWWTLAMAGTGSLDVVVGGRTAPEAGLEQDDAYEYGGDDELEPAGMVGLVGRYAHAGDVVWVGLDGSAWGIAPETETTVLAVSPSIGVSAPTGDWRLDAASAYDFVVYPIEGEATSGRVELYGGASRPGTWTPTVSVVAADRHYLDQPSWGFRSAAPSLALGWEGDATWARLTATGQVNQHQGEVGTQVRGRGEVGVRPRNLDLWMAYTGIAAQGGAPSAAQRPVFTLVGGYSDDADAISGGGFYQHRGEAGASWSRDPWAVRLRAMGRYRIPYADDVGAFDRTGHAQLDLERHVGGAWHVVLTGGVNGARAVGGTSFLDVYGWTGVSWRP